MSKINETGHAKNVVKFQKLKGFALAYGDKYNPSQKWLALKQLDTIAENAAAEISTHATAMQTLSNNINERRILYKAVRPLLSRLYANLKSSKAPKETLSDAMGFIKKIRGIRARQLKAVKPVDGDAAATKEIEDTHSAAQTSYSNIARHLEGLNGVLASYKNYNPNETELQTATVTTLINTLTEANNAVDTSFIAASYSRINRNKIIYTDTNSMFTTAQEVKDYIKSVFGAASPQYRQVSAITFRALQKD